MIWDATIQKIMVCTATNTWSQLAGGSGGGNNILINGVALSSSTTANFQNSAAFNGLTGTFSDLGFGNIRLGFTGALGDGGITGPYSGVGTCGTSTWAKTLNRNAIQTCTQPGFTDISSQIGLAQLPTIASNTFLGNVTGSPATPVAVLGTGGGTNPLLWTATSLAAGQIPCANSSVIMVNCTPGIPVVQLTSSATISNVNRATLGVLNSGSALAVALPSPASLPNNYFADYYVPNSGTATFTSAGGTFINCSGPGSATTQQVPPGWFAILYNDGTNYCLPAMPTDAAFPTTGAGQALGFNGTILTTVSVSGNCSGTFAAHTACINNTGGTAAPTQGAIGTQDYSPNSFGTGGGTANAQTVTLAIAPTSYANNLHVCWLPTNANTSTTTLNVNAIGVVNLLKAAASGTVFLASGDLNITLNACADYDSNVSSFVLENPANAGVPTATSLNIGMNFSGSIAVVSNQEPAVELYTPVAISFGHIGWDTQTVDAGGGIYDIGVYNASGTLICDIGPNTLSPTGLASLACVQGTSLTIPAGKYYIAFTGNSNVAKFGELNGGASVVLASVGNAGTTTGGQLLSTITPLSTSVTVAAVPFVVLY
jgi:hypothetical protein